MIGMHMGTPASHCRCGGIEFETLQDEVKSWLQLLTTPKTITENMNLVCVTMESAQGTVTPLVHLANFKKPTLFESLDVCSQCHYLHGVLLHFLCQIGSFHFNAPYHNVCE